MGRQRESVARRLEDADLAKMPCGRKEEEEEEERCGGSSSSSNSIILLMPSV